MGPARPVSSAKRLQSPVGWAGGQRDCASSAKHLQGSADSDRASSAKHLQGSADGYHASSAKRQDGLR